MMNDKSLWQEKLDQYIRSKLVDPQNQNRRRWVEPTEQYVLTHTAASIQTLRKQFGTLEGLRVMDFGCGDGLDAINLARERADVTGVDSSRELIEIAQLHAVSEGIAVKFLTADRRNDWYRPEHYDAVTAIDVLEHVERPEDVISTAYHLLRPGGILILTTPNRWALGNIFADPHWRLFGVTLLPQRLAKAYVVRIRRVIREYDMTDFIGLPTIREMLDHQGFVRATDNVIDVQEKLISPSKVVETCRRRFAKTLSGVSRVKAIRTFMSLLYCYAFVRTWRVAAKKPSATE